MGNRQRRPTTLACLEMNIPSLIGLEISQVQEVHLGAWRAFECWHFGLGEEARDIGRSHLFPCSIRSSFLTGGGGSLVGKIYQESNNALRGSL